MDFQIRNCTTPSDDFISSQSSRSQLRCGCEDIKSSESAAHLRPENTKLFFTEPLHYTGSGKLSFFRTFFVLFVFLSLPACSSIYQSGFTNFSRYYEQPLPEDVIPWLQQGEQTQPGELLLRASLKVHGETRRERLFQAVKVLSPSLRYDAWENTLMFKRTAEQLFEDGVAGGCADFALIQVSLFRIVEIPARLVITADSDWIKRFRKNSLAITVGHVFIEVYLEDKWYLVDPAFGTIYSSYTPGGLYYPHRGIFCLRGIDYWTLNLKSVEQLNTLFAIWSETIIPELYRMPQYTKHKLQ